MARFRVVVTDDRFGSYEEERRVLAPLDCTLEVCSEADPDAAAMAFSGADALLVNMYPVDRRVIESLSSCRVLCRYGVGYDNIDVEAATERGIWVARVPDYGYEEVSDHALAFLFALSRNLAYVDRRVREGGWNLKNEYRNYRIRGSVLGLVGFGLIGRAMNRKVRGLGLSRVLVCDPYLDPETIRREGAVPVELPALLASSDFVSLHLPLSEETRGLIGEGELAAMKPTAILINTARGPIVDERALIAALEAGEIRGAGLDVYEEEPLAQGNPLLRLPRVLLTDHTAYYSEEAIVDLKTRAAQNVAAVLSGGEPLYAINRPEGRR